MSVSTTTEGIEGEASSRRLFFFWLVDDSYSMQGQKIQKVNWAIRDVLPAIRDIENNERVKIFMSAIRIGHEAKWHIGPQAVHVDDFSWKELDGTSGTTSTAHALELLADALNTDKVGTRSVPPVCILLSDGYCTDEASRYNAAIDKLNNIPWGKKAVRLSIGIAGRDGEYSKDELDAFISPYLRKEGNVETLHADTPQKLVQFIKAASTVASVSASRSATRADESQTPPPAVINMEDLADDSAPDQNVKAEDVF